MLQAFRRHTHTANKHFKRDIFTGSYKAGLSLETEDLVGRIGELEAYVDLGSSLADVTLAQLYQILATLVNIGWTFLRPRLEEVKRRMAEKRRALDALPDPGPRFKMYRIGQLQIPAMTIVGS